MTIAEAAAEVLRVKGKPLTLDEILHGIVNGGLYQFNSPDQLTILREQVRRHCLLPDKTLQYAPVLFVQAAKDKYTLMDQQPPRKTPSYRRVRRAKDKELLIEKLTGKGDNKFGEIWRLLIFAGCLGVSRGLRVPIEDYDTGKSVDFSYFSGCPAWPGFMHLLGLVEFDDPSILNPDQETADRQILVFEEYANGGLSILAAEAASRDYSMDSLISLMPLPGPEVSAADAQQSQI